MVDSIISAIMQADKRGEVYADNSSITERGNQVQEKRFERSWIQDPFRLYVECVKFAETVPSNGHAVVQLVEALRYKPEGSGFDSRLEFSFRPHYGAGVHPAFHRNEY